MSEDLETGVVAIFQSHVDASAGVVTSQSQIETLGIHSLELTEIVMDIEDKYGIEIDLSTVDSWASFKTVGDLVEAVKRLQTDKA